jgi:hypothetical protein
MNKSIFERIFPHSPSSSLPRYEEDFARPPSSTGSTSRITLRDSSRRSPDSSSHNSSPSQRQSKSTLQSAPLSASIIHHDDPFLPISRAAKSLERTLQNLLDAQSDALEAGLPKDGSGMDDVSSVGSPTPTPSMTGTPRHEPPPKLIPIRQPKPKKLSLRGARRGLTKTMEEFARLKSEEMKVISVELHGREDALKRSKVYTDKRATLQAELEAAEADEARAGAAALRSEAEKVQHEIHELESRLFELRTRHRYLVAQAEQYDNTVESKLSSYKHSLSAVDRDVRHFLRHPPVSSSLTEYDHSKSTRGGMYALKPDRRTLEMAKEQWSAEHLLLQQRQEAAEKEQLALQQGAAMWKSATERIHAFEKYLRQQVSNGFATDEVDGQILVKDLDGLIASLQSDIDVARSRDWMLLLVALGAEWAALCKARVLLTGEEPPETGSLLEQNLEEGKGVGGGDVAGSQSADPPEDLLNGSVVHPSTRRDSEGSNQSLKDTLRQLAEEEDQGKGTTTAMPQGHNGDAPKQERQHEERRRPSRSQPSDSEDDDPGPDFLLSHS